MACFYKRDSLIGYVNLRVPHTGIVIEHAVKATLFYRPLHQLRVMNKTAEIGAEQPKTKIPKVIENLADQVFPWVSESDSATRA